MNVHPDRIKLSSIRSLTFYAGELTTARRTQPIPQLICDGAACRHYEPDVVRCVNAGGSGTDVDWTCTAELPERLKFGRVEVGCEGWSKPGDEYVLKGSCSLTYRLVELPREGGSRGGWFGDDVASTIFGIIWIAVLLFIVISFLKSCFRPRNNHYAPDAPINRPGQGPGYPGGYGSGAGDAPPPYSAAPPPGKPTSSAPAPDAAGGWRPGFWTGAGLGALGAHLLGNRDHTTRHEYDWERERWGTHRRTSPGFGRHTHHTGHHHTHNDRGEGSSGLGRMQTSTGFGGSNVR